ncbi:hypothetical protein G7046_g7977 [Stylonectria norvegica]|nr:hypothetical protein G7046_g7977 [Stylonectria norvegica]
MAPDEAHLAHQQLPISSSPGKPWQYDSSSHIVGLVSRLLDAMRSRPAVSKTYRQLAVRLTSLACRDCRSRRLGIAPTAGSSRPSSPAIRYHGCTVSTTRAFPARPHPPPGQAGLRLDERTWASSVDQIRRLAQATHPGRGASLSVSAPPITVVYPLVEQVRPAAIASPIVGRKLVV